MGKPNSTADPHQNIRKTKRIASNTIVLFLRMFVITIINLYAVRLVVKGLGQEDYGIFNTVAGVVTCTSFVSSVLALSIQRFFSYALGKHQEDCLQDVFSISLNIIFVFSALFLVFFETVGLWFVDTQLTIPSPRRIATLWLYEFSLFAFLFSLLQIPFTAALFSHEDMGIYAMISTVECVLKLVVAILLFDCFMDHLEFYGLGLLVVSWVVFMMYALIGHHKYAECSYARPHNRKLYKKIVSFGGWTLFGSLANTGMVQGSTILINIFFGPIVNVAFGIAQQVNNAFNALCNSMVIPFRPAMIKAYAETDYAYLNQLFSVSNKFLLYVLSAVAIPLIAEMDVILRVWLGYSSVANTLFCRLMIVYIVFLAMHNPITIIMHASGHIKEYHLPVESITLLCLPVTWVLYRLGCPSSSVFASMILLTAVAHAVRLLCLRHFYPPFSIGSYIRNLILPGMAILAVVVGAAWLMHAHMQEGLPRFCLSMLFLPLLTFCLAYFVAVSSHERKMVRELVSKKKSCA